MFVCFTHLYYDLSLLVIINLSFNLKLMFYHDRYMTMNYWKPKLCSEAEADDIIAIC